MTGTKNRIVSIDILRGITILVMIFVNDVAGGVGTPAWMKHISPPLADGMTFVDWVSTNQLFHPSCLLSACHYPLLLLPVWNAAILYFR